MSEEKPGELYVQHLLECQDRLYAYILMLVGDLSQADDIRQSVNLLLWRRADEWSEVTDFGAWACRVAYYECLTHRKRMGRDKLMFNDDLLSEIAEESSEMSENTSQRLYALRRCLAELPPKHRKLIENRYGPDYSTKSAAENLEQPVATLYKTLYRIRKSLLKCVEKGLTEDSSE